MPHLRPSGLLALSATLAFSTSPGAPSPDPRPALLVVGETSSLPAGNGPSWPMIVQKAHPDWNVLVFAESKQPAQSTSAALPAWLEEKPPLAAAIVFLGTQDAAPALFDKSGADAPLNAVRDIIAALRKHPGGERTAILVATPMPVIEARLDKWSVERFKGGEAHCDAIAEALRKFAGDPSSRVTLVDFHRWAKDQPGDDGKPGRLLGTIGWTIRDWRHPLVAGYFEGALAKVNLDPADPAAFAAWKTEAAARSQLEALLAKTSEGLVDHGPPLTAAPAEKGPTEIAVPVEALDGDTLEIVFQSGDKEFSAIGQGSNLPAYQTVLRVGTDSGEIKIPLPATSWQVIDEATPATPVDPATYRFNAGKMNYYATTASTAGARRWVLARFPLEKLKGKHPTQAALVVPFQTMIEKFTPPDKTQGLPSEQLGRPTASIIRGRDRAWDDSGATWKTRDGKTGWTGGKINVPARRKAIEDFLKSNPPPPVAAEARRLLE